jgi:polyisoprenoid-binding protein YceI
MCRSRGMFLVGLLLAASVSAEKLTLELDPGQTRVEFGFGATLHSVSGSLRMEHGRLEFDSATGVASGMIVLDAKSAQTGVARRDEKMHQEILESASFPKVTYTLERIDGKINRTGRSDLQLHGTLELHGVRLPAAILAVATVNGDQVTATGTFIVPYREWGMKDPSVFVLRVEKEVHIQIKAVGVIKPAAPAG